MEIRVVRIFILTFVMQTLFFIPAQACSVASAEDHHYPSCSIPLPKPDQLVTVIGKTFSSAISSHFLSEPQRRTRFVRVHAAPSSQKHYLVLNAFEQTIWKIEGDTKSIAQVIVLGAALVGPAGAGVIGVPADLVHFTTPDLSALDNVQFTSCTRVYKACTFGQWFGAVPPDLVSFHPMPRQSRLDADVILTPYSEATSRSDSLISIIRPKVAGDVTFIDPASVVSQQPVQPYPVLPGSAGLQILANRGALAPKGSDIHSEKVSAFAEAFSARYRSRFDPDFMFTPVIDFVVTRAITLPPEMPPTTILVARGVPAPDMNGNIGRRVCLYFEGQASKPTTRLVMSSVKCRQRITGPYEQDDDVLRAAHGFDNLGRGLDCRIDPVPEDTHVAVVALSEGTTWRNHNRTMRQINIDVGRNGPVALYLSMEGGPVQWNLTGADIVAVYMHQGAQFRTHQVLLDGKPFKKISFRNESDNCPSSAPQYPNRLGPAIAQLDRMMSSLLGHKIDQLITHTETGQAWREADAPIPVFVIK